MTTPAEANHADLLEYEQSKRLENERRFSSTAGCPYGCDGSGWKEVDVEGAVPHPFEVVKDDIIYTPCECNARLVWNESENHYESKVIHPYEVAT